MNIICYFRLITLAILMSNEKLSKSITNAPDYVNVFYDDVENFIENNYMQISFITTTSMETTLDKVNEYLESKCAKLKR